MTTPIYSVIIPAYNEETLLPRTLAMLKRAMSRLEPAGEVIVVDNNSSDRTAEIAREYGARVVTEPVNQISRARNAGARAARGAHFIFLDGDTLPSSALIAAALSRLLSGRFAGGGAMITFSADSGQRKRAARFGPRKTSLALAVAPYLSRLLARLGICGGSFIFCPRDAFEAVGGFSESVYVAEDVLLSRALKKWGQAHRRRFEIIKEISIRSSDRKFRWHSPLTLTLQLVLFALFPFAVRYKALCRFWYSRPDAP